MIWRNTPDRYGVIAKFFHWTIAALILTLIVIGLIMVDMAMGPEKFKLFFWHKSLGLTVLFLAVLRVLWKSMNLPPLKLLTHRRWEYLLADIVHFLLYFCMLAMPLSGWMMSSARGMAVSVFGLFTMPLVIGQNKELGPILVQFHIITAYVLIGLISLHVLGALKHVVIDRDNTLRRMLPFARLKQEEPLV